ncbi:SDR family oxidoreductase [Spongiactinospora sp. 9N601]|uniref:SDR family oxidoreductase n=1 Tax=Spongiactinospora sp. 9N601 TaxID=3375149 RepID=UPI0037937AB2
MILVTGATGSIGRYLVRELLERDLPVRAFVRDAAKGRALGCEFVLGDFDDPSSLAAALKGVDRVFLNGSGVVPADGEQPMVRQQRTAIDLAREAGVSQVVKLSVWQPRPGGKLSVGAHWAIEQHLKESGPPWTILQPNAFMQNFLTGQAAFTMDGDLHGAYGDGRMSYIDCADIAACAARLLADGGGIGETYALTGPEALDHHTIAARLSRTIGRTVRYQDHSPEEFASILTAQGVPAWFASDAAALYAETAAGHLAATTPAVHALTGRPPRTFDDFLTANQDHLRAAPHLGR